ncbi:MAG: 50S ribosomal protein L15 [Gammaproteobacteria bacterium]|nr:50S ribosomal protein L15 [Gammaproteobacteria bacterium]
MDQHTLRQSEGAKRSRKRVGRGDASGHGRTAARGMKGQRKRGSVRPGFEGGQISVVRRLPRLRGFTNPTRVEFLAINLGTLEDRFDAGATVDAESLAAQRLIEDVNQPFKILGRGELGKAFTVKAPRLSESAKQAITSAGGSFEELAPVDNTPRNRVHRRKAQGN